MRIRIGTRKSDLAMWQARHVAGRLEAAGAETEIVRLETRGDRIDDIPLSKIEGKAFFTAEIEKALLDGRVDLAVHSHKDLPVEDAPGLRIVAVPERATISERLLVAPSAHDTDQAFLPLATGASVGTSAPRRSEQLNALRPDLEVRDLRGNVPTRVRKLREGRYDAIVLAAAGLERLQLDTSDLVDVELPTGLFVPAPAQGALAIQAREDDEELHAFCRRVLHDEATVRSIRAERRVLVELGGGCSLPFGACIESVDATGTRFRMRAFLGADQPHPGPGPRWVEVEGPDPDAVAGEVGKRLASGRTTGGGPLSGMRVALTGSSAGSTTLGEHLELLGASVLHEQVLAFEDVPCPDLPQRIGACEALAVTSREAARRLAGCRVPAGVPVAAVGPATARVLAELGFAVAFVGAGGARELARDWDLPSGGEVLFPCAEGALPDLEQGLEAREIRVTRLPIYRTIPRREVVPDDDVDARIYMSPSSVEAVLAWERERERETIRVALGRSTAEVLAGEGLEARQAEPSRAEGVARCLASLAPSPAIVR